MRSPLRQSTPRRGALWLALLGFAIVGPSVAHAERLLFVSTPEPIVAEARTVLVSWGVEIVAIDAPSPGPRMPGAENGAKQLAREHEAAAVVWLVEDGDTVSLWMYDVSESYIATRRLDSAADIGDTTAAALALSIKTLLRHSQVAPPDERYVRTPDGRARLVLHSRLGGRWRSVDGPRVDARIALGVSWMFRTWLAVYAEVGSGPGLTIEGDLFDGHLSDNEFTIGSGLFARRGRLSGELRGGFLLQLARLRGRVIEDDLNARVGRTNPALVGQVQVLARLGRRIRAGVFFNSAGLLKRQTYLVRGEPVLRVPRLQFSAGFSLEVVAF